MKAFAKKADVEAAEEVLAEMQHVLVWGSFLNS